MLIHGLWLLLLPIAAASGWAAAKWSQKSDALDDRKALFPKDYLLGLNFLLNEEPDKALDVFLKMVDVDSETVETHLALGNLFRRRGEVNRAIRIHQNLIARPTLSKDIRVQALFALAKDYLSAGVLDRAESLFLELVEMNEQVGESLQCLLSIYQQEKNWQSAIQIAQKINARTGTDMHLPIAHHYCELAELALKTDDYESATRYLKKALSNDSNCVRASLLFGNMLVDKGNYKQAIRHFQHIKDQDPDYFVEAITSLVDSFRALSKETELILYFKEVLKEFPRIPVVVVLSEQIRQWRGDKAAATFVADYVRKHPSIAGVHRLVELQLPLTEGRAKHDLSILHSLTQKLLAAQPSYQCINCGFAGKVLHWQCPSCKRWSSMKPMYTLEVEQDD
ncbi:MAG: lipopolysaccharide assembly protein LapB [Pseudomonadota bacterium]